MSIQQNISIIFFVSAYDLVSQGFWSQLMVLVMSFILWDGP